MRHPGRRLVLVLLLLLLAYYAFYLIFVNLSSTAAVPVRGADSLTTSPGRVTLAMRVTSVDPSNRTIEAQVRPVPSGSLGGNAPGELAVPIRLHILSSGQPPTAASFPADSIVDAVTVQMTLDGDVSAYPFDKPSAPFRVQAVNDKTGDPIPADVTLQNAATPWTMTAHASSGQNSEIQMTISPERDGLSSLLALFQLLAIVATTAIAISSVGSALVRRSVDFSKVIWLSATLVAFPALRSSMPNVPPIGTTMDFLFFFPCVCIIALALVWTTFEVAWKERPTRSFEEEAAP